MRPVRPKVSICIPVYNGLPLIESTVGSVLAQTFEDFEVVIRDDCSRDGTWQFLIARFGGDPRFRLYQNEKNLDIGAQYNRLFNDARGEMILKLDADDLINSRFLERTLQAFDSHNVDVVGTGWEWLTLDGKVSRPQNQRTLLTGEVSRTVPFLFSDKNPFSLCFTVFRRIALTQTIRDDRYVLQTEICDWELLLRLALSKARFYYIEDVLGQYRIHGGNRSMVPNAQFESSMCDVLPYWYGDLVRECGAVTVFRRVLKMIRDHLKAVVKGHAPLSMTGLGSGLRLLAGRSRPRSAAS